MNLLVDIKNNEQSTKRLKHSEKLLKEKFEVNQKDFIKPKDDNGTMYTQNLDMVDRYNKAKTDLENDINHITQQNLTLERFNQLG